MHFSGCPSKKTHYYIKYLYFQQQNLYTQPATLHYPFIQNKHIHPTSPFPSKHHTPTKKNLTHFPHIPLIKQHSTQPTTKHYPLSLSTYMHLPTQHHLPPTFIMFHKIVATSKFIFGNDEWGEAKEKFFFQPMQVKQLSCQDSQREEEETINVFGADDGENYVEEKTLKSFHFFRFVVQCCFAVRC